MMGMSDRFGPAHPAPGYTTDDLRFNVIAAPDDYYSDDATGPVLFVPVANSAGVLGYLWGCDAEDAAGFVAVAAGGDDAVNAGVFWNQKLRPFKRTGCPPSRALRDLAAEPGGTVVGRLASAPPAVSTLAAVRALAGS
jgi:hypothetical protein